MPTVLDMYAQIWRSDHKPSKRFLALLNVLFALAWSFKKEGCCRESEAYYHRSLRLFEPESREHDNSLMDVQILLLRCHYLQTASAATGCWAMLMKALGLAYALGINRSPTYIKDNVLRQTFLRVWLGCQNLDV
jgi:hypothetical protein